MDCKDQKNILIIR